jgi:hypothetical protein
MQLILPQHNAAATLEGRLLKTNVPALAGQVWAVVPFQNHAAMLKIMSRPLIHADRMETEFHYWIDPDISIQPIHEGHPWHHG